MTATDACYAEKSKFEIAAVNKELDHERPFSKGMISMWEVGIAAAYHMLRIEVQHCSELVLEVRSAVTHRTAFARHASHPQV